MEWLESFFESVTNLPDVIGVAAADETGTYIEGVGVEETDEFAAILTFIGRSGVMLEETLGLDSLNHISLSGKKIKLIVYKIQDYFIGIKLKEKTAIPKIESKINHLVDNLDIEGE